MLERRGFLELFKGDDHQFSGHIRLEVDDIQEAARNLRAKGP